MYLIRVMLDHPRSVGLFVGVSLILIFRFERIYGFGDNVIFLF